MTPAEAPIPPNPNECCGNGCEPCIWDIYREELHKWQEEQVQTKDEDTVK